MAAQDGFKGFAIAGRTASGAATAVDDVDQEELRLPIGALLTQGILPNALDQSANPNAFNVRQDTGSNMQLKVGSGTAKRDLLVLRGTVAGQGSYIMRGEGATKTITVPAADATNPARYGVFAYVNDTAYSGTASRAYFNIECIRGTPAGSPATPGPLAAWSASFLLWEFQLAANATAVTNTILDAGIDQRVASIVPIPALGLRPFTTTTKRDALIGSPVEGQKVAVTGEDREYTYSGSAWQRTGNYSSTGRTGCHVGRLGVVQTLATATLSSITFETVVFESDTWHSGSSFNNVVVPTGLGGVYVIDISVAWSAAPTGASAALVINGTDNAIGQMVGGTAAQINVLNDVWSHTAELAAGDTVGLKLFQQSGSNRDVNCRLKLWRVMI